MTRLNLTNEERIILMSAISDDKTRHALRHICIKNKYVYSSDGKRAVRINLAQLERDCPPDGVYSVVKVEKMKCIDALLLEAVDGLQFPNVDACLADITVPDFKITISRESIPAALTVAVLQKIGCAIDTRLLDGVYKAHKSDETYTIRSHKNAEKRANSPVILQTGGIEVCVMPFNTKDLIKPV